MHKLGRDPLGDAAYQISKPSSFREYDFSFFVQPVLTQGGTLKKKLGRGSLGDATHQISNSMSSSFRK